MPVVPTIFLFLAAALLLQSAWSLRDGFRFVAFLRRSLDAAPAAFQPTAAVLVPVRGDDPQLEGNLDALLNQIYDRYELIFAVARETDPAYPRLARRVSGYRFEGRAGPRRTRVIVAGTSAERGEKVNNLLAALRSVPPETEVLVFADADGRPRPNWLRSLVAPLGDAAVTVSTGFRWYLPGAGAASRLRAAWDSSIATLLGPHRSKFAWGGSMAVRAADFQRLQVAERYWARTVSDDYSLTRAVENAGGWIRFEPKCLVPSAGELSLGEFIRWANRQMIITRVYARKLWVLGLASHALFGGTIALGVILALTASESRIRCLAAGLVALILLLGIAKARLRTTVARLTLGSEVWQSEKLSCYWRWWPLVPWVMLLNFVTAGLTRRIEWRGTEYELVSTDEVRVTRSSE